MSQTLMLVREGDGLQQYPTDINTEAPGSDYGNVLARLFRPLDDLASSLGVRPLGSFLYTDPDMLHSLLDELQGAARDRVVRLLESQCEWHDPTECLRTVDSLLEVCSTSSASENLLAPLRLGGSLDPLLWDLRALRHLLSVSGNRFHLEAV